MERTCPKGLGFALLLTPLSSCTIAADLELYNNTAVPVTVMIGKVTTVIAPSEKTSFSEFDLHGPAVRIAVSEKTFVYKFERLPLSHIAIVGWGPFTKRVMRAQIEQNGTIWAVGVNNEFPVIVHDVQPEGFPVQPQNVDTIRGEGTLRVVDLATLFRLVHFRREGGADQRPLSEGRGPTEA